MTAHEKLWVEGWSNEKFKVAISNNGNSIALMHKMDFDPFGKHSNPWVLDMIYTAREYRRRGLASQILQALKGKYEITAFCSSESSENLFRGNGYTCVGEYNHVPMYRS
jgi:GNAT superfamily N-acetyltransferase